MAPTADGAKTHLDDAQKTRKVTTACDTCRLKRQKCDGAQPHCQTCIESNLECTYSRQARRRGPPLGFLRHVEVRLHIGDAFLGYVISEDPGLVSELLSRARSFAQLPQDPTSGQAISEQIARWDNWAAQWRETDMSRILDGVSARFATPVSRPELESPLKTSTTATTPPAIPPPPPPMMSRKPASKRSASIESKPHLRSPASDSSSPKTMDFAPTYRHPAARTHASSDVGGALPGGGGFPVVNGHGGNSLEPPPTSWPGDQLNLALADLLHNNNPAQTSGHPGANNIYGGRDPSTSSSASFPHMLQPQSVPFEFGGVAASNSYPWSDHSNDVKPNVHFLSDLSSNSGLGSEPSPARSLGRSRSPDDEGGLVPTETDTVRYQGSATGMHHQALESSYTGSFWRSQPMYNMDDANSPHSDAALSKSQLSSICGASAPNDVELPPAHIQQHLAEIYLQDVHPIFPLLSRSSILSRSYKPRSLVLALCAYCACLSPNLGTDDSGGGAAGVGDATRIAAEMWYEQARTMVMVQNVRRQTDIETIQTIVFLVLRDQGRGKESQAWLLMGVAVRISIDLGLHLHSSAWVDVPEDVKTIRRRVWGVVCILDLLLSLQLGRPSAIFDAHWASEIPVTPPPPPDAGLPSSLETSVTATPQYFAYTSSLCLIISRINYQLYLSTPANEDQNIERLESLRRELDNWREALPSELRISIGHQASLPVLDVNLLYHVAIILLYRPFRLHPSVPAIRTSIDAAATFNALLTYYRSAQRLKRSNPHIIYLIFTGAIAHLSGVRALRSSGVQVPPPPGTQQSGSASMTVQYNLVNCVAALKEISASWPLAERCHRIMTGLMDAEGLLNNEEAFQAAAHAALPTRSIGPPAVSQYAPQMQQPSYRRSRSVEQRGYGFTPINTDPTSSEPPRQRRRHDSGSGTEHDGGGGGHKRPRGGHHVHPYLSRHSSSSASHNRSHGHQRESPTSSSSATGSSSVLESESPPAVSTAASLLSLASSASSSHTYLPGMGSSSTGTPSHNSGTPPSAGMGRQMDFTQLPQMLQQHQQQQLHSDDSKQIQHPRQRQQQQQKQQKQSPPLPQPQSQQQQAQPQAQPPTQQQPPQHQPAAQPFQQQNTNNQQGDPYLVDFDPFSGTGWATLEQDPFQQPSFYMNA